MNKIRAKCKVCIKEIEGATGDLLSERIMDVKVTAQLETNTIKLNNLNRDIIFADTRIKTIRDEIRGIEEHVTCGLKNDIKFWDTRGDVSVFYALGLRVQDTSSVVKLVPKSNPHTGDCNVVPLDVADRVLDVNSNVPAKRQRANGSGFISPLLIDVGPSGVQNVPPVGGPALPTTGVSHCTLMSSSCGALPATGQTLSHSVIPTTVTRQPMEIDESSGDATHVVRVDNYSSRCPCSGMQSPVVPMFEQPRHVTSIVNNHSRARRDRTRRHPTATAGTSSQHAAPSGPPLEYKDLGNCAHICQHCGALFWFEERLKSTPRGGAVRRYSRGADRPLFRLYNVIGAREYELPTGDMLGAIVYEAGPENDMDYDIVLEERSGYPKRVNKLHPSYMSLQFPLLFIYGQDGYSKDLKMINRSGSSTEDKRLTMLVYYSYYLHDRANQYNYLSRTGKLFQQYVVTAYCAVEQNRIDFIREHQNDIRNEYLSGIYDAINRGDNDGSDCGLRLILPQSFTGGPRYMYSHYLDALAICCVHGNPLYFITFTCNVNWPEITNYMAQFPLLTTTDRADIVDRVFEMKIHKFVNYLRDAQPFGKVVAVLYTVEFQKRGLPHCHTLLWIDESVRPRRDEDIDMYVSAELPAQHADPQGYRIVSELMMHGPCGLANPSAACTQNNKCKKDFPKEYCNQTYVDKGGFVHYKRRDTGVTTTRQNVGLDNRYVVPYNKQLLLAFYAHINVEYCGWTMLIKYLFKYISKGTDRVVARMLPQANHK
ncbi:DNA helicase [Tanacetum coccineum]|uniref:DNA helicase n=1 Tax=Tanacetum coccineum TaxID=301880 RepID=A0ABQ4ZIB1_9ASTR